MEVRRRRPGDLTQLDRIADAVRASDGYPPRVPDLFTGSHVVAAWVAVDGGDVVGHVALHRTGADSTIRLAAEATGWPAGRLAVVSRLLVAPAVRRRRVGQRLLARAVAEAHATHCWPVLDVAAHFDAAIALYETSGWTRVGAVTFQFRDGVTTRTANSLVFVGPRPPAR